jgi:hypothetical protein
MQPDPTLAKAWKRAREIRETTEAQAINFNAGTSDAGKSNYPYLSGALGTHIQFLCEEVEILKEEVQQWREARDALQAFVDGQQEG